jgi:hypothetical protein
MKSKIGISLVLLLCIFNLVPPLFNQSVYFDNVYYLGLYLVLTYTSICLPFLANRMNKWIKRVSTFIGGWFFSGLVVEIINLSSPLEVFNSIQDKSIYMQFLITFTIGITIIIISETWQKQTR